MHFSKWVIATNIIGILQMQAGFYFLGYFDDSAAVGIFSSAWNLAYGLDILVFSLITVFLPKVSKFKSPEEFKGFIGQTLKVSVLMIVCLLPIFFFAEPIVLALYSDKYSETTLVFQIMFVGTLVSLPAHPISLILLSLNKPHIFTIVGFSTMILTCIGNIIIVPEYSVIGAAGVTACMKMLQGLVILWVCYSLIATPKQSSSSSE